MNKAIEIGAMILGSASLLFVSFLGFAVMSGVPLNEVAVVGRFFPAPDPEAREEDPLEGADELQRTDALRPPEHVVASSMGLMSAYSLPSPYTQGELKNLTEDLKARALRLDRRANELDARENTLEELEEASHARLGALEDLQERLDGFQRELLAREREIQQGEAITRTADAKRYAEIARVLVGFPPEKRTQLLTQYLPDEAAMILQAMDPADSGEALAGLAESLSTDKAKEYVEAYSRAKSSTSPKGSRGSK